MSKSTGSVTSKQGRQPLALLGGAPVRTAPFPAWPIWDEAEEQALLRVLNSGKWGRQGAQETERFEHHFAAYHGAEHGIAVVNGTVALRVALLAAGIEAGDEVIVPPYTFLATASSVVEANAVPVFADIDPDTFNIDPRAIESLITPRTRAVIPVHLGGLVAPMDEIMAIAGRHGLTVIEDAAHAHGAQYKGRRAGSLGHLATFSFQSSKNMTCGEGGIVVTNERTLARQCRSIHDCGRIPGGAWYEHHTLGANYRMGEFQAAILNCQLDRLDEHVRRREANAACLAERLTKVPGVTPQLRPPQSRHAYHLFAFRYDASAFGVPRKVFLEALAAEGVPASAGYAMALHRQPLFVNLSFGPYTGYRISNPDLDYTTTRCPVAECLCAEQGAWFSQNLLLGEHADIDDIATAVEKIYACRDVLPRAQEAPR